MNRYKISMLLVFVLVLCSFNFVFAFEAPLFGKIIYLDPGHGGIDPGAIYKDIYEKDINLEITNVLADLLEKEGAIVYLTRYGDYDLSVFNAVNRKRSDLSRRGNIINKSDCDMYLSIHLNADSSNTWYGAQVFYDDINSKNKEIAEIIQNQFKKDLKTNRNVTLIDSMYLHKRIDRPGILIEAGFITNANERYLLRQKSYQLKISNSIKKGIIHYFKKN